MKIIYFDYDRYELKEDAVQALKDNAQTLLSNPNARILIQGSCDERGTNEYNLALGEKRGNVARDYLVSLGVDSGRIAVLSLGEESPVCQDHIEDCWWRNRKDEFVSQ
ncbi:MAG: OmpA family protein [Vicinamibacteria bacterium]